MTATDPRLAEIRARAENATPGPWDAPETILGLPATTVFGPKRRHVLYRTGTHTDAEFVAHARADVPWLLDQGELRDKALKAVLELHRPGPPYLLDVPEVCEHCSDDEDEREVAYPCPTILAITTPLNQDPTQEDQPHD